jgi:hypothetical protein
MYAHNFFPLAFFYQLIDSENKRDTRDKVTKSPVLAPW